MLMRMAKELNPSIMGHNPSDLSLPHGGEGAQYLEVEQGQSQNREAHVNLGGLTIGDSGYGEAASDKLIRNNGEVQMESTRGDQSNYWLRVPESSNHRIGGVGNGGTNVIDSTSDINLGDYTQRQIAFYERAGDGNPMSTVMPNSFDGSVDYGMAGNTNSLRVHIDESDLPGFTPHLDYTGGSSSWRRNARWDQEMLEHYEQKLSNGPTAYDTIDHLNAGGLMKQPQPLLPDPRLMRVHDPTNPMGSFQRTHAHPLTENTAQISDLKGQEVRARLEKLAAELGLPPGEVEDPQQLMAAFPPDWVDHAQAGVQQSTQNAHQNKTESLKKNQRLGGVGSMEQLKRLHPSEEEEWLRRATETDMTMVLAIEDTNLRNDILTRFVELHEMDKKGSQFSLKFAEELMGLVKDDSPQEFKDLVQRVIQIVRVRR